MTRLPLATRGDIPQELLYVWEALARGADQPRSIFRLVGNNPEFLRAWSRFGNAVWGHAGLDLRQREIAILRLALRKQSRYEWHQHVRAGLSAGLSAAEINDLHTWEESAWFSGDERALLAFVDELCDEASLSDETVAAFSRSFPAAADMLGVTILVLFYGMIARLLEVMEVETEEPFVGWRLA